MKSEKFLTNKANELKHQLARLEGETGNRGRHSSLKDRKVAVKYRDGSANAWAGRGAQPVWLAKHGLVEAETGVQWPVLIERLIAMQQGQPAASGTIQKQTAGSRVPHAGLPQITSIRWIHRFPHGRGAIAPRAGRASHGSVRGRRLCTPAPARRRRRQRRSHRPPARRP